MIVAQGKLKLKFHKNGESFYLLRIRIMSVLIEQLLLRVPAERRQLSDKACITADTIKGSSVPVCA